MLYPHGDEQFQESIVQKVRPAHDGNGHEVDLATGFSLWLEPYGHEPKKGDVIRMYGKGLGYPVRGVFVGGEKVRYMTEVEYEQQMIKEQQERDNAKRAEATAALPKTKERIAALSPEMQARLDKFDKANPEFWWNYLPYELMCCEQATELHKICKTVTELEEFRDKTWEEQKKAFPKMESGHSGNSFGFTLQLCYFLIVDPKMLLEAHGALAPLVGCETYGCHRRS